MLNDFGCEKIYTDQASGVREDRKGLNVMINALRRDDTLVVFRIDRIFRSLKNMVDLIKLFNKMGG